MRGFRLVEVIITTALLILLVGCMKNNSITGQAVSDVSNVGDAVSCANTAVDFVSIADKTAVCYKEGFIFFNVENIGDSLVKGIVVETENSKKNVFKQIKTGEIISDKIAFAVNPSSIIIYPIAANDVVCKAAKVSFDGVSPCE